MEVNSIFFLTEITKDILVIYEEEAKEWALYLKSLCKHIIKEEGILLYNLEISSIQHLESLSLSCYRCKLLILSNGLLKCLNQKRSYFLDRVLDPPSRVVILLCGVENSDSLYERLTLDQRSQEIFTDQDPEEYLSIVAGIIQQDYLSNSEVNLQLDDRGASVKTDKSLETEVVSRTLETTRLSVLVLPTRISCENPGEIFILLRDEITETVEIEFITDNQRIRTQPAFWNQKVRCMQALDFPAGPVNVNVYCEGVIKAVTQIEYYTAVEEIEYIFKKVADPIAFACQVKKLDSTLTFLLKSKVSANEFSVLPNEEHHQQAKELPTLLHCAAKFGLKNLATLLLQCPGASQACRLANKCGENPAHIAGKHGHKELQKIIQELSVSFAYLLWREQGYTASSLRLSIHGTRSSGLEREDKKEEEEEEAGEEDKTDEENKPEETSYNSDDSNDYVYASIPDDNPEENRRDAFFLDKPLLPPRDPSTTLKQDDLHYFSQGIWQGNPCRPSWGSSTEFPPAGAPAGEPFYYKSDEEDPYTFAQMDDSVYDMILATDEEEEGEEKRKERRSFIINRPPAPTPRPPCSPIKEENTPYIVQVFQQKATGTHSDNEKMYSAVRNDSITYTTLRHSIPSGQEELILLQEQVKKGTISMDEALEKFKEWQNEKSRLEVTRQEKVRQLRDSIIGKRPEEENLYGKLYLHIISIQ
uniref:B-cell scaffold protein with ankyrin repeats n=1 Tax=Pelusios castaneus TaxID=367368 RepID=A0A8C8VEK7_9SAUR